MSTKKAVLDMAARLNAKVVFGRGSRTRDGRRGLYMITVDAPDGYEWADGGTTQMVICENDTPDPEPEAELWADALDRMRIGLDHLSTGD